MFKNLKYLIIIVFLGISFVFVSCASNTSKKETIVQDTIDPNEDSVSEMEKDIISHESIADVPIKVAESCPVPLFFGEIWGYLLDGRENDLMPATNSLTDIGYFGAGISTFGNLTGVPNPRKVRSSGMRVHMVIADNSRALTHFCLSPEYSVRKKLINDIVEAASGFDGVQIDFELVSAADKQHYLSFLSELKRRMPKKIISVAIPARVKTLKEDAYSYAELNGIVDRIVVMAYDEHWSTSKPGPVASIEWCKRIMNYATKVISANKLIMGLPFYGRAWNTDNTEGAYKFTSIERVQNEQALSTIVRINDIPTFSVIKQVEYKFYYDDLHSLTKRMTMYSDGGVQNIAFWRLGQEDVNVWNYLVTGDIQ